MQLSKQEIDDILRKNGITKWTKWKNRLERRVSNVSTCFLIWCLFYGVAVMGWKTFWISLFALVCVEFIVACASHFYYTVKWKLKHNKSNK